MFLRVEDDDDFTTGVSFFNPQQQRRTPTLERATTPELNLSTIMTPRTASPVKSSNILPMVDSSLQKSHLGGASIGPPLDSISDHLVDANIHPSFVTSATQLDRSYQFNMGASVPTPEMTPQLKNLHQMVDDTQIESLLDMVAYTHLPEAQVSSLDIEELRHRFMMTQQIIDNLQKEAESARMTARHWALQHSMLESDFKNEKDRFEVEKALAGREVEVLRQYDSRQLASNNCNTDHIPHDMDDLIRENDKLKTRMKRAKRVILDERAAIVELEDQIERLKKRIRDNRAHNNMADRAMVNAEANRTRDAVYSQNNNNNSQNSQNSNLEDGLAALGEVASQVLAEQRVEEARGSRLHTATNSPIRTPIVTQPMKPQRNGSLPMMDPSNMVYGAFSSGQKHTLMSPLHVLGSPMSTQSPNKGKRRRLSRDSTISASGDEGETPTIATTVTSAKKTTKRHKKAMSMDHMLLSNQTTPQQKINSPKKATPRTKKIGSGKIPSTPKSALSTTMPKNITPRGLGVAIEEQWGVHGMNSFN